jgi:hypothetical protein
MIWEGEFSSRGRNDRYACNIVDGQPERKRPDGRYTDGRIILKFTLH